ncbi:hypothetical protein O988_04188 [Pseudogymnoascus sp. VKM F-3808]|nr:hypothetical protein O988_04188 [Pseudogymnoascus sp. VKM F-3808]
MEYRFLGNSGLQVSAIALGGWLTYGGHVENENTFLCMKAAYDIGINFFDCAECYSNGESERIIGQAIKRYGWKRNDLVISTKIYWGGDFGSNPNNVGLSRKHVVEGLNGSLERLGLDYVDLVYAHRPDRNTPIEETVRAFNHIIDQGKAFYWGTSEWSADEIATAWRYADKLGLIGPLMEQPCYNMLDRGMVEREYRHLYESPYKLGLTVFSPLHGGLLSGKYGDGIPSDSRFAHKESDPIIMSLNAAIESKDSIWVNKIEMVKALRPIAERLGISQTNLAYAWVLSNNNVSSAITGASKPQQIYDAVKALDFVKLLDETILREIDDVLGNRPSVEARRFT